MVLNNDLRHPAVLAREAAGLADLSGGRFELGLGAGYMQAEYDRAGLRFEPAGVRVARLCESVQVLRGLLDGETVTFDGEHYARPRGAPRPGAGRARAHPHRRQRPADAGLRGPPRRRARADRLQPASRRHGDRRVVDHQRRARRPGRRLRELSAARAEPLPLQALVQSIELTSPARGGPGARRRGARAAAGVDRRLALRPRRHRGRDRDDAPRASERFGVTRWTLFVDKPGAPPIEELAPVVERVRTA